MSKALKVVSTVAGVVSVVAGFIPGGQLVSAIAAGVSMAASIGAQLTQKKPPAQGSVSNTMVGANLPSGCALGRTYCGGNLMLDSAYGPTLKEVPNPYRTLVYEWSVAGPVQSITPQVDFTNIGSYYTGWMTTTSQLGLSPQPAALAGPYGAIPNWGADYKMSGHAATIWSLKFDKDGKVFASGVPQLGAIVVGVKVYDPRQDDTYPGGAGPCRSTQEATYVGGTASENPGCHGVTYLLGRRQNGKVVFGPGFAFDEIDMPAWVAFMNLCDANSWKVGGSIYEPGSIWDNLKRICAAGGGEPVITGGLLSVRYSAPRVALDTISANDLADGEIVIPGTRSWRDRINGIVPKYRSEANRWDYVQSDEVTVPTYVEEDGEAKVAERQYDLVQDKDQAAQLAAYELVNGREIGPIIIPCKPRLMHYRVGDAVMVDEDLDDDTSLGGRLCTIIGREVDPTSSRVTFTLETETTAKHAYALDQTGTAPPTPMIGTGQDADTVAGAAQDAPLEREVAVLINTSSQVGLTVTATDTTITISEHLRRYSDKEVPVAGGTVGTFGPSLDHWLYYEDPERDGVPTLLPALENRFLHSEAFDDAAWSKVSDVGAVTVTANAAAAPDGSVTADRVDLPAVGAGQFAVVHHAGLALSDEHSFSVWLRGAAGGEVVRLFATPDGVTYLRAEAVLTMAWQRVVLPMTLGAANWFLNIGSDDRDPAQDPTPAQSFFLWGAQLNRGLEALDYRRTGADAYPYFPPNAYRSTTDYAEAFPSPANPFRHYAGYITSDVVGGTGTDGGGSLPPGGGGSNPYEQQL